jgi:hypothetical protein
MKSPVKYRVTEIEDISLSFIKVARELRTYAHRLASALEG